MTTIKQVYEAIQQSLEAIPDLRVYDYPPENSETPCAFVGQPTIVPENLALSDLDLTFDIVFLVSANEHRHVLYLFRFQETTGTSSVLAHFQANRSLGFSDVDVYAGEWRPLGLEEMALLKRWGAACTISVRLG